MTVKQKIAWLADPKNEFVSRIRVAENGFAGLTFANGWVASPPAASGSNLGELSKMPVSGWGSDVNEAIGKLMMEAVERNSSVYLGSENLLPGRIAESPFNDQHLAHLAPDAQVSCVSARSMLTRRERPVPAAFVYLGYAKANEPTYAMADSTGCAAGDTLESAELRGLLEAVERDALAIWWFNQLQRPSLALSGDVLLEEVEDALRREGRQLFLVNLTNDLQIPVVAAVSASSQGDSIYVGCAAGTSLSQAAQRAAGEMVQFWFWDKLFGIPPHRSEWVERGTLDSHPWLMPQDLVPLPSATELSPEEARKHLLDKMTASGYEPWVIDLTRPWFDIPVVKVMIPGFCSHQPGFAPKRLLEVPVKLGWRRAPTPKAEMMPFQCPL